MAWGSKPVTRRLCVLALLLGLTGMHGLADGGGCHSGAGPAGATSTMAAAMSPGSPTASHRVAVTRGMPGTVLGSVCVFVQSAGWPPMVLALLGIVGVAALAGVGTRRAVGGVPARSPPLAGVLLLRRVCVSLT